MMELTIATLFTQVFVMRHQMTCCRFLCFSIRLTCGLLKNHRTPPAALLLHTNRPNAVPVEFPNHNDSVTRVARRLHIPTMRPRDILLQAKGIILVESTQIRWFSRWSCGGGWSGRVIVERRPRVSKLGLKGLSGYYSNEIAVAAARWEASRPNKRATLMEFLLKMRELDHSSKSNCTGQKAGRQRKIPLVRKTCSLNLRARCRRELIMSVMMMMSENQSSKSQVHVTVFQGTEG